MALAAWYGYEPVCLAVPMDLPEMGLTGEAVVTNIQPAPAVRSGNGRVVTATFKHSSGDCIDLVVADSDTKETFGTTSNHPFWSVDRQDYVQAGSLQLDERVQTYSGDTKRVISKLPRPGPEPVYNLEVHGEHVYYVGLNGVLVHNTGRNVYAGGAGVGAPKKVNGAYPEGSYSTVEIEGNRVYSWQPSKNGTGPLRRMRMNDGPRFTDADRVREWKRLANDPNSGLTAAERAQIKARGNRGPQRLNEYGELETMELSHESIPLRDGGTSVVPRWPADHPARDPHRHLKKRD